MVLYGELEFIKYGWWLGALKRNPEVETLSFQSAQKNIFKYIQLLNVRINNINGDLTSQILMVYKRFKVGKLKQKKKRLILARSKTAIKKMHNTSSLKLLTKSFDTIKNMWSGKNFQGTWSYEVKPFSSKVFYILMRKCSSGCHSNAYSLNVLQTLREYIYTERCMWLLGDSQFLLWTVHTFHQKAQRAWAPWHNYSDCTA